LQIRYTTDNKTLAKGILR